MTNSCYSLGFDIEDAPFEVDLIDMQCNWWSSAPSPHAPTEPTGADELCTEAVDKLKRQNLKVANEGG